MRTFRFPFLTFFKFLTFFAFLPFSFSFIISSFVPVSAQETHEGAVRTPVTEEALMEDWLLQDLAFDSAQGLRQIKENDAFRTIFTPDSPEVQGAVQERALVEKVFQELQERGVPCEELKSRFFTSLEGVPGNDARWKDAYIEACKLRRTARLESARKLAPKLIFTKHYNLGGSHYAYTEGVSDAQAERTFIPGSQLCILTPGPDGEYVETVLLDDPRGVIRDPEVTFDGKAVLFAWKKSDRLDDYHIYRLELEETPERIQAGTLKQLTYGLGWADYEPCSLADGDILFNSTRCSQIVDCFWTEVSNLYRMDAQGRCMRRMTYDQVHDNYPVLAQDGRVMYTRWDYNDRGQIFPQGLFQMNADGTAQTALYGNNSWFPTTILHTRPILGTHGKLLCIFSGHHSRQRGKLGILDPNKGREEADGATLAAPIRETLPVHVDAYGQDGEQFCYPVPLTEKDFLVAYRPNPAGNQGTHDPFSIYAMDVDGRRELLVRDAVLSCNQTAILAPKTAAPERPSMADSTQDTGIFYLQDVFYGPGLEGVDKKSVRSLRVVELAFRTVGIGHNNNGGPAGGALSSTPISIGGGAWDPKKVLGEAKIYEDGSACFRVPAKTPLYFQVIDDNGHVIQTMRSWSTLQPGETFSCIGCHEDKNTVAARGSSTLAMREGPQELTPFYGPARGFSFEKEIQPILDRHCVRCHDNSEKRPPYASEEDSSFHLTAEMLRPLLPICSEGWSYTTSEPSEGWTQHFPLAVNESCSENRSENHNESQDGNQDGNQDVNQVANPSDVPAEKAACPQFGNSPFGLVPQKNRPRVEGTPWETPDIWLTRELNLPENYEPRALYLYMYHDEDVEVYINGVEVMSRPNFITNYIIQKARQNPLHPGRNVVALHCRQTGGSQGIDVGFYEMAENHSLEEVANQEHPFSLLSRGWNDPLAKRVWSESYMNLTNASAVPRASGKTSEAVRWINIQDAPPMLKPYTSGAAKSGICFMFNGPDPHNGVKLMQEEKDKIACWIDLLVPFCGTYEEHAFWEPEEQEKNVYYTQKRERSEALDRRNYAAWSANRPEDALQVTDNPYRNLISEAEVKTDPASGGMKHILRFAQPVRTDQLRFLPGPAPESGKTLEVTVGPNVRKADFSTLSVPRCASFPQETVTEIQITGPAELLRQLEVRGISE